jgi:vacuolar-type H+-ATPase subunit I/STV1
MTSLLDKINSISEEIVDARDRKDFHRLDELLANLAKDMEEAPSEERRQDDIKHKVPIIYSKVILSLKDFSTGWETKKTEYKDEELESSEKLIGTLFGDAGLNRLRKEDFPANVYGDDYLSKSEASLNTLKTQIGEEKKRRREDPGPGDDSSLDKQIEKLKSQIKDLEQKLRETPDSDAPLKNSYREQIRALERSLREKELKKSQSEKGGFPTNLVIGIGVGAVVVILSVILYLQLSRRNQRY